MPTYFGEDVSFAQGALSWVGYSKDFAIAKCGGGDILAGGTYTDSQFANNKSGLRSNNIKRGYYWFGSLGINNPVTEANAFTNTIVAPQAGEILVLDAEFEAANNGFGTSAFNQTAVSWCKSFLDQVTSTVGFRPLIYMSQSKTYELDWSSVAGAGYPLWVASFGITPTGTNLFVGAWSSLGKGYPLHQYSDSNGTLDLDAFFVPAGGTLNNWDGYGKGGTSTTVATTNTANVSITPTTNHAGVTAASFYFQSDDQSLITPTESHDQVIYSVVTTDATLTTGTHNGFYTIPTTINQQGYPFGRFSYDGGTSWNDFGFTLPATTLYASVQPGVQIQPAVYSNGSIIFSGVNNTAGTVSLILQVGVLASMSPSLLKTPLTLTNSTSYTNDAKPVPSPTFQDFLLPPYSVYRRIAIDSSTVSSSLDVAHGQSTIPNIMFWVQDTAHTFTTINACGWASTGSLGALGIRLDATNIHLHVDAATYGNAFYRAYKDN